MAAYMQPLCPLCPSCRVPRAGQIRAPPPPQRVDNSSSPPHVGGHSAAASRPYIRSCPDILRDSRSRSSYMHYSGTPVDIVLHHQNCHTQIALSHCLTHWQDDSSTTEVTFQSTACFVFGSWEGSAALTSPGLRGLTDEPLRCCPRALSTPPTTTAKGRGVGPRGDRPTNRRFASHIGARLLAVRSNGRCARVMVSLLSAGRAGPGVVYGGAFISGGRKRPFCINRRRHFRLQTEYERRAAS